MSGRFKWQMSWSQVTGAMHTKVQAPCQDAISYQWMGENGLICAIADGHGSLRCPYSKEGAQLATKVATKLMRQMVKHHSEEALYTLLKQTGEIQFPKLVEQRWKEAVKYQHLIKEREPLEGKKMYELYGTTLMLLYVTTSFIFSIQIGDGDIVCIDETGVVQYIGEAPKTYGVETHSLCENQCWRYFKVICKPITNYFNKKLFLMSTDGYANSFVTTEDFFKAVKDYLSIVQSEQEPLLRKALPQWLEETTRLGSGDDITLALIYLKEAMA
ncbi:MAG: protein phosphatase 2C domain-containing protein [Cellulosilyticum sp.]|nr:protein phosphatase 2C domain-containing protein [Cellulosilyticum sp.]